jgi:hypothetical protein
MLPLTLLLVACALPVEDPPRPPHFAHTSPATPTPSTSTPTASPTTGSGASTSTDTGTPPIDTAPPADTALPDTGDTAVPALDATGAWIGSCVYYGAPVQIELDLVDVAGVVTGAGTLHLAGYPVYLFSVTTGSRVYDAVELHGQLSDPAAGYAEPAAWSGRIIADSMNGNVSLNQGGGIVAVLACTTAR